MGRVTVYTANELENALAWCMMLITTTSKPAFPVVFDGLCVDPSSAIQNTNDPTPVMRIRHSEVGNRGAGVEAFHKGLTLRSAERESKLHPASRAGWLRQKHAPPWAQCFLSPACWAWETNWRQTTSANQWPRLLITESHQVRVWCGYGSKPWYLGYSKTAAWWMFIPGLVISFRSISRCLGGTPLSLERSSMLSALCGFWSCLCEGEPITADSSNCKSKCFVNMSITHIYM